MLEIEKNIRSRKETDRIMWFSMWVILSVASFGLGWFLMIYYLIKRRNAHFSRQKKLEELVLDKLIKKCGSEKVISTSRKNFQIKSRNAMEWSLFTILVIPAFYVFYFLIHDLQKHEENENEFLMNIINLAKNTEIPLNIQCFNTMPSFQKGRYVFLSVITFGMAAAYWLYQIFNDYNSHFKMQWMIEDEILNFFKELDQEPI